MRRTCRHCRRCRGSGRTARWRADGLADRSPRRWCAMRAGPASCRAVAEIGAGRGPRRVVERSRSKHSVAPARATLRASALNQAMTATKNLFGNTRKSCGRTSRLIIHCSYAALSPAPNSTVLSSVAPASSAVIARLRRASLGGLDAHAVTCARASRRQVQSGLHLRRSD